MIVDDLKSLAVSLSKLKLASSNPRMGDIEAIKKSYERFGQRKPIVAHKKTKEIIAGNHQYQAAQELGWEEIAVVWVDDDEQTATAYSVADNRIGQLGEWNVEELMSAFDIIGAEGLESVGFDEIALEDFRALADEHEITIAATSIDGGGSDRSNRSNPDTQVEKEATYDEFLERYVNRATRGILLYYPQTDYAKIVDMLDQLGKKFEMDNNADVVRKLIEEALK
jgi:ParB-like chromosome segregation protein Spo0J